MRVLSVVPRYAVTVGSLKARRGGTVIGKTHEERGIVIRVHAVQLLQRKNKKEPLTQIGAYLAYVTI